MKQLQQCWNKVLKKFFTSFGIVQSSAHSYIYVQPKRKHSKSKSCFSHGLNNDDGYGRELHYCLGITIAYTVGESLELHQEQYIEKMLKKYQLEDIKPVSTPPDLNVTRQKDDSVSKAVNPVVYKSMIGSLQYAAVGTRPNISHAVGVTSMFS